MAAKWNCLCVCIRLCWSDIDYSAVLQTMSELKEVVLASGVDDIQETKAAQHLGTKVEKMMTEMNELIDNLVVEKKVSDTKFSMPVVWHHI